MLTTLKTSTLRFARDESGVTAVEYGVLLALILGVIIVAVTSLGGDLKNVFTGMGTSVSNAAAAAA
jgi:pilus assembly protein Flp/PilA